MSASRLFRPKSLGMRGCFRPNRDKAVSASRLVRLFLLPGRNLRGFGVAAVSAQVAWHSRLQLSASAVCFGIVDTSLDSLGASRENKKTPNNYKGINHNSRSRQPEPDVIIITYISGIELRDTRGSWELSFTNALRLDLHHPLHPSLLTSLSCFFSLSLRSSDRIGNKIVRSQL